MKTEIWIINTEGSAFVLDNENNCILKTEHVHLQSGDHFGSNSILLKKKRWFPFMKSRYYQMHNGSSLEESQYILSKIIGVLRSKRERIEALKVHQFDGSPEKLNEYQDMQNDIRCNHFVIKIEEIIQEFRWLYVAA